MDLSALFTSLQNTLGNYLPAIFGALGILIVGWIVAVLARAGTRRLLAMLKLDQRIVQSTEQKLGVEIVISTAVFWLVLLVAVVGVFNALHLELISRPFAKMVTQIISYFPQFIAGIVLILLAWIVAALIRQAVTKVLTRSKLDQWITDHAGMRNATRNLGNVLFWLVVLLFIPAILAAFELKGLLEPVRAMLDKSLGLLPNIFVAVVIGFGGWLLATVLRGLVVNLMSAAGTDRLSEKIGLTDKVQLPHLIGTLVFLFVFVPGLIAALDALQIQSISGPATQMLAKMLSAVPNIIAAAVILIVAFYVARFVSTAIGRLLNSMGFDSLPLKLGVADNFARSPAPSDLAGGIILFFSMLFATAEAAGQLGFTRVSELVATFIKFGGDVLLGGLILVIGFWLANVAFEAVNRISPDKSPWVARVTRVAILGLITAMGLRAMGIADDIVNLAFGLTLGAVAVAVALSFGLGGREAAAKQMEHWFAELRQSGRSSAARTGAMADRDNNLPK